MAEETQNFEKERSALRKSALKPFLFGCSVLLVLIIIICYELFWAEDNGGDNKSIPAELWFVFSPGIALILGSFVMAFQRWRSSNKIGADVKVDLI